MSWNPNWGFLAACFSVCLFVSAASHSKGNPLRVFEHGCAIIRDLKLKDFSSRSMWVVPFKSPMSLLLPETFTKQKNWVHALFMALSLTVFYNLFCKPGAAFCRPWYCCCLSSIFFLSSLLVFHLYYYFLNHEPRSSEWHNLFQDHSGSHALTSKSLGDGVGGQEGGTTKGWCICWLWLWFYGVCICQNPPNNTF